MTFKTTMETIGYAIDAAGVVVIVAGILIATIWFVIRLRELGMSDSYTRFRQAVGRAILLGLEFLVAGDIIRTVAVAPTLENVAVLGGIVLIRTFLSLSLEFELEGRLPFRKREPTH